MNKKLFVFTTILCLALCLSFVMVTQAAEVTLSWDANIDTVTGYRIFSRTGDTYDYTAPDWQGADTMATVTVADGVEVAFVVRAYRTLPLSGGELESADSNEVVYTPDGLTPESPQNVIIQKIVAAWKWIKNYFKRG